MPEDEDTGKKPDTEQPEADQSASDQKPAEQSDTEKAESEPAATTQAPRGRSGLRAAQKSSQGAEEGYVRVRLPDRKVGELFGIADQLMGGSRLKVMCEDGISRLCRIPGKMKRRMWIREGDLVILKPWEFQDEKADIKWRYTKTQASYLSRRGLVPKQIDVF